MLPSVHFADQNPDRVPSPWREFYQAVVKQAIEDVRPAYEMWTVHTHARPDSTITTFALARDYEAAREFAYIPEDDDVNLTGLYQLACVTLRGLWPGGRAPS